MSIIEDCFRICGWRSSARAEIAEVLGSEDALTIEQISAKSKASLSLTRQTVGHLEYQIPQQTRIYGLQYNASKKTFQLKRAFVPDSLPRYIGDATVRVIDRPVPKRKELRTMLNFGEVK